MNITFLLTQSLDSPSGLGRYSPLAKELSRLGQKVVIHALHPDYSNLAESEFELDDVEVHYLGQMHVAKNLDSKSYFSSPKLARVSLNATLRLSSSAVNAPHGIIHVGKPHPMNGIAGWLAAIQKDKQFWLDCDDYEAASGRFASKWQYQIVTWFERWLPKKAYHITVNTYFMLDKLVSWGVPKNKILYLPNGVERSRFQQPNQTILESLRSQLGLKQNKVIAYIGSLSLPSHPVDILLKAFVSIQNAMPQTVLLLVGGGEDYEHLRSIAGELGIASNVIFTGRIRPEEVPSYYHMADLTIDPVIDNEAARGRLPLKCFESWAAGTPFVTADVGDRRRILGDPPAGYLANPSDTASLAETVLMALSTPGMLEEMRVRGLRRVETYYWDQITPRLLDAYKSQLHLSI